MTKPAKPALRYFYIFVDGAYHDTTWETDAQAAIDHTAWELKIAKNRVTAQQRTPGS